MKTIKLGIRAKDEITGFIGIVTAKVTYITGCDQYCLVPPAENGKVKSGEYFDENRIEFVDNGILPEEKKPKKPATKTGYVTRRRGIVGGIQRDQPKIHEERDY